MHALRDALRHLRREPRVPLVMVVVLALALGACAAVFSILNAVLLKALPYPYASRLVTVSAGARVWSIPMFDALQQANSTFDALTGLHERSVSLSGDGAAEVLRLEAVSPAYFDVLGIRPAAGRTWTSLQDAPGVPGAVAVISEALWQRRYGADPSILGRPVALDGTSVAVIGVLPREFHGLIGRTDVWVPLRFVNSIGVSRPGPDRPWSRWFEVIGRVKPGLTPARASASADLDVRRAMATLPDSTRALGSAWRPALAELASVRRDPRMSRAAGVLAGAVGFVMLLAAINLAGLQLVRAAGRSREFAIRAAIGGAGWRLLAPAVSETAFVAGAGLAGGFVLRGWFLHALVALRPEPITFGLRSAELLDPASLGVDARSALMIAGAALVCGATIAALPVARARRPRIDSLLRATTQARTALGRGLRPGIGGLLVASELALAVMVGTGAALMVKTAMNLWGQDRAVQADGVLTLRIQPPESRYGHAALPLLFDELERRIAAVPGVAAVSVSNCAPGSGRCRQTNIRELDGRAMPASVSPTVGVHFVTPGHFALLRTPMVAGRGFEAGDTAQSRRAVIVNESAAERLWPGQTAVGHRLALFFANGANTEEREVVGVVRNVRFDPIEDAAAPDVYLPAAQTAWGSVIVFVRAAVPQETLTRAISAEVARVDPDLPLYDVKPLAARLGAGFATERFVARTLVAFAVAALLLAAIGVHGLVSHAIAQGQRELAIRAALGATRRALMALLFRRAAWFVGGGLVVGVAGSLVTSKILAGFLYGVQARDAGTLTMVMLLLAGVAFIAVLVPARRGVQIDPARELRGD